MTIPDSVQLLGSTVRVFPFDQVSKTDKKTLGISRHSDKVILLADTCRGRPVPSDVKEHTFFHELLHQILDTAGYKELSGDEQFVDLVSGLLHQALGPCMK